ncbi:MAG: hypothetical protein ACI3ZC_02920 [Candidatus Cryptobacteroides sp.]
MKTIYRIFFTGCLSAFAVFNAAAQSLNTTVSVTREYEGKLLEAHKPSIKMNVPDSLTQFNLDFDYSVFENPYKGSYDFKPYTLDMRPAPEPYSGRSLYLKAGAGWRLRPSLDFVWEPRMEKRFRMAVYASHHSYIGKYRNEHFDSDGTLDFAGGSHDGYDMETLAGIKGRTDFNKGVFTFNVGYQGLHTKDSVTSAGWNAANAGLRVRSVRNDASYFHYDVAIDYRYAVQGLGSPVLPEVTGDASCLRMSDLDFKGSFGPVFNTSHRFLIDLGVGVSSYSSLLSSTNGIFSVTPKYVINKGILDMTLGAEIAVKLDSDDIFEGYDLNSGKGQFVYPDVHIGIKAVKDYLNVYLSATGGMDRNTYASLKGRNHFYNPFFGRRLSPMSENTVERFNLAAGFEGNIAGRFRYDLRFGYASLKDAPVDAVAYDFILPDIDLSLPAIAYKTYDLVYSDILLQWESRDVSVDSRFRISSTDMDDHELECFEPAFFSGDVRAMYNYRKRVRAGLTADFASRRRGLARLYPDSGEGVEAPLAVLHIPLYVNLGAEVEFALTSGFSLWLRGDNLLNMNVQRSPYYYAGGIGFTAGICLNL